MQLIQVVVILKVIVLLGGVDLLGEDLLELLGSGLLDGLRDLAGAGGVADLAGLSV